MSFAILAVLAAALLPYLTVGLAKWGGRGVFDNARPRATLEELSGWPQRAEWAHRNHFEAFPAFAAAVVLALLAHAKTDGVDLLAGAFVVLRVIYTCLYIAGVATVRSLVWTFGFLCVIGLFVLAASV